MFENAQAMYTFRMESVRSFESIYFLLFFLLLCLTSANIFLYHYLWLKYNRRQISYLKKNIKLKIYAYGFLTLCLSGWILFAQDRSMSLRCDRRNSTCEYFRSTHFNKLMRFSGVYDFSGSATSEISYRNNNLTPSFYTLKLRSGNGDVELPMRFSTKREAKKEVEKFNAMLTGKTDNYTYTAAPDSSEVLKSKILIPVPLLILYLQIRIFVTLLAAAYGLKIKR